ncbi:sacsin-like [Lytechinus pictus]|uniref:sacsin-like n=1 Tax=Lytechinus pictus TaxID=7653 RepID=UPI0030B9CB69
MRQHGTKTLYKDSLQPYQGPAVYSFNNAKFKTADWEGIQQPARSRKKTDPLKVGRFGIGFNSVYHITDLPSIMSDETLAFIDPLEEHFFDSKGRVKTGWRFYLRSDKEIFSKCHDQFQPYNNVFPGVTGGISTGYFDGTLFRFPLRQEANELSEKIYQQEDTLDEVLQAFQADANVAMLFLRSLNNIEVLKRSPDYQDLSLIVRVQREHDQGARPRGADITSCLQSYISNISGCRESIKITDCVTFTTETQSESKREHWVVSHHIAGDSMSQELTDLAGKQGHLPWVAVAIPMSSSETSNIADEAENNDGRVFCFLPLPPGEESRTGLPVHVHGFFGINSDRRGIKWLGPDQTDTPAQWNQLLVRELIPMVYVDAIKFTIDVQNSRGTLTADCIYRSWPDYEEVRGNWGILLEPFYNALFSESIIHSDNSGWKNIADVHFNELQVDEETEKAILKCFNFKGIAHARVPGVCRKAIRKYYDLQISTVSVSSLCRCLHDDPAILERLANDEKLLILQFILQEDAMQDLEGLCLLPLDNGGFEVFSSSGERRVYIPTPEFHRQLVPGGCDQFIRTIQKELPLHQLLSNMSGHYQLETLTIDIVAKLLKTFEKSWIDDQGIWVHEPQEPTLNTWLEEVWSMLYREIPSELQLFNGIHLIPLFTDDSDSRRLLPLCSKSRVIQRCYGTADGKVGLTDDVENILHDIGMRVTDCPGFILRHPAVIRDGYIKIPTPDGVVQCLLLSDEKLLIPKLRSFSARYRDTLVEYLAQAKLGDNGKKLLKQLPLFKRVDGTGQSNKHSFSVAESLGYIECNQVDIPNPLKLTGLLIDGRAKSNQCLLQKLEACPLSKYHVIVNVLEEIRKGQLYTQHERQVALQWILERWEDVKINCKSIVGILREMKFIPNKNASLLSPSELLDPRDPLIYKLFESQGAFPMDPFDSPQIIEALSQLGMRGKSGVSSCELNACVDMIEESQSPDKSRLLLELLSNNPGLLSTPVIDHMKRKECIPCRQSPPEYYPSAIEWYGISTSRLSTPSEILGEVKSVVLICGASKRFSAHEDWSRFSAVFSKLGINAPSPLLAEVVKQLEYCVNHTEDRTREDTSDIVPMLKEIYSFFRQEMHQGVNIKDVILNQVKSCIWNGNGFSEPSRMSAGKLPFDLYPYMVSIPKATSAFGELFQVLGVQTDMMANSCALVDILYEIKERCEDNEIDEVFQQGQLQLVLQILNHLQAVGDLSEDARLRLLVPSQKGKCHLIPVEKGAYVDRDWLRQSTDTEDLDDDEDFTLVHSNISMNLAIFLHIRPVSRLLLDSEEFQGFTQAGQHEPLTIRLCNILKNNYTNTSIANEMIQNAEDAGAQEVRFLVDMRTNENAHKKLFDPGMKPCQGPALWVYNDAVFSDQDLENILHLGGRTKERDAEKIGKFGTGFNSVYHITDVPSFVSRDFVQFFDPHTTHLGNVLPNKSQPGVRLRLNNTKALRRFPDQFKPFDGVFDLTFKGGNEPFNYQGTLFRLPLRSQEAAQKSQICKECYDGEKLVYLMKQMCETSHNLLVFTKHVTKVSLFYLSENASHPTQAEELLTIQKTMSPLRTEDDNTIMSTESFSSRLTSKGAEILPPIKGITYHQRTSSFDTLKVVCKTSEQALALSQSQEGRLHGLSPEAAVALPLNITNLPKIEGEIYCGLPLSVPSLLPMHINGKFAINEDRRSLQSPTPHGMTISERWNDILLSDMICRAYISLLSDNKFIQQIKKSFGDNVSPELFWPDVEKVHETSECSQLFNAFYKALVCALDGIEPAAFWKNGESYQFHNVRFLGEDLQREEEIKNDCITILTTYVKEQCGPMVEVIELSEKTWRSLKRAGVCGMVETRSYSLNRFFEEAFLPHVDQVPNDLRDRLILFALRPESNLYQKLRDVKCISVLGEAELKPPYDLMNSNDSILWKLFESNGVFPCAPFNSDNLITVLKSLGMRGQSKVTPVEIVSCVDRIEKLQSPEMARALLELLENNPIHLNGILQNGKTVREVVMNKQCIPCRQSPPEHYPLDIEWHGKISSRLTTPQEILIESKEATLSSGASKPFVSQSQQDLFSKAFSELGITSQNPVIEDVLTQLEHCVKYARERTGRDVSDIIPMLKAIYGFVNEELQHNSRVRNLILDRVKCCVWNGSGFSEPSKMCTGGLPFDLAPYMASIPKSACMFKDLFESLGVKRNMDTNAEALVEILHEIKRECNSTGVSKSFQQRQRQLVLQILHHLHASAELTEDARLQLLIPSKRGECHLIPVEDSAYIDREWLRQSTENEEMDDDENFTLIHSDIPMELITYLRVRPVSQLLLDSEELDGFTEAGQHEHLTMRLYNILKNNYVDTAIVSEMIQNAEDAGAEVVNFLIDMRKNGDANQKLFNPEMISCQGPALWVYNDAVFTDQDFENILRLGGRTKEKNAQKIGKFGTGFNSVYRITDVPSFVSRDYMQFFDPHTTHLGNVLPNKNQPGVRLRLSNSKALRRFPDQFKPFHGVFDFSRKSDSFNYSGTLFRLPLRSQEAAQKSQICKECYNGAKLIDLMKKTWESSHNLLVFTKNVKRVALFFLDEKCSDPSMAEELFTIQKTEQSTRMNDENIEISTESFKFTMTPKGSEVMAHEPEGVRYLEYVKVTCKTSDQASALARSPDGKDCGLSPEGAVAFPFHKPSMSSFEKKIYCFLPLSITSMFPVHINGAFAVKEDRRSLHMPVPNGRLISEKWNHLLLVDVICRAYIALMSDIVFIQRVKEVYGPDISPDQLWPDTDDVPKNSECSALFNAFFKAMVNGFEGHEPSMFWIDNELHQFSQVVFLGQEVQKETSMRDIVRNFLSDYLPSKQVMSLTDKTWRALERVDLLDSVMKSTYDFNRFFAEAFLPRISQVQSDMRNQLVLFALNKRDDTLKQKLKDVKCIPVVGGPDLRKPCDLVHPSGKVAPLYSESDKVFPLGDMFNDTNTLTSLTQLGMIKDYIHEDVFLERCRSVDILHSVNKEGAQNRSHALLNYLSETLRMGHWSRDRHFKEHLVKIPFLPILCERNQDTALPWVETNNTCPYASANDIYSHSKRNIVSSMYNVVHESKDWKLPWNVEDFLGIRDKYPSTEDVIRQFSNIRSHYEVNSESISNRDLEIICQDIYERVENACRESVADDISNDLQNQPFFLVGSRFVGISVIADRNSLPPYLFEASRFLKRYPSLLKHAGLKNEFGTRDYEDVLHLLYIKSNGQPLSNDDTEVAILAAQRLSGLPHGEEERADTFLPDEQNCMRPVSDLCYRDVDWFENDEIELHRCHTKISFMVSSKLKVKDIRQQMLQAFDMDFPGDEFGQHEKLTTRIKRILDSYPSDETILKELLQNADDAGATEIHFVYDPRKHKGHKLLGDGMKALQGHALCVFNNQSFTDDDIRGIQNLGEGSKADHMGKIGRYGVGFNAVYQLTDCPSFISKGERWCMFDPLLKYVPGANPTRPGRQIKVNSSVRRSYPHSFQCYMEDILTGGEEDFTIFRFPLRQEASTLSPNVWHAERIRKLLRDFENAAFECLLFLKHVTKISISEVSSSGVIGSTHVVSAEMTRGEGEKKMDFLQKVQDIALTKQDDGTLESEQVEVIYQMKLKGVQREEDWVICQQVSYSDADEEHTRKKHRLIPVGAVAARLPETREGNSDKGREGINGKAFCFLPLPIETGLPVHVHGYFALDHESRRHLWDGSKTDEQTKWNLYITQRVIAPAYIQLLSWIQKFFIEKYDWSGSLAIKNKVQTLKLQKYHSYFPNTGKGSYWRKLQDAVFEIVVVEALLLFPSLYRKDDGRNDLFLSWKTPISSLDGSDLGYFNTLSKQLTDHCTSSMYGYPKRPEIQESINKLKETLIEVTFPLIESPIRIMHNLRYVCNHLNQEAIESGREANYEVREVTPSHVISFLRGDNPLQRQLPKAISSSRIHNEDKLIGLIDYCKMSKEPNLQESLHGLPLLFTMDGTLRMFSRDDQVFATEFCDLFWPQSHRFLHIDFLHRLSQNADAFCKIDMRAVSKLLDDCFPFLKCTANKMLTLRTCHPPEWFCRLWILLESLSTKVEHFDDFANNIKDKLRSWAILPVTETKPTDSRSNPHHVFKQVAPISLSSTVIDQPSESNRGNWPLYSTLESLNVYKIEKSVLHKHNIRLIKHFVLHEHMGNSARVLNALMYWVERDPTRFQILKEKQHSEILRSFFYCDDTADLRRVKDLPCFKTIAGDFVSIRKCQTVLVLPSMIPEKEQDKWIERSGAIFLQYNQSLEPLYKKLALTDTTEFDVYMKYILPVFGKLSEESRLEHLVRINQLLHSLPIPKRQNYSDIRVAAIWRLGLRDLRFINCTSGNLLKASDLYDPDVEVFYLMLKDKFPSTHIIESLGLEFLREIGLQTTVTADLFLSFAHRVRESDPDAEDMKIKSTALVSELVRNCKLHKDYSFCRKASVIDFLVTDRIDQQLESIHTPFIKDGTLMRYSSSLSSQHTKLIWSTNSILPEYAALRQCFSCKTQLDDQLGKAQEPELNSVIQHLQNICNKLQQINTKKLSFSEALSRVLHEIMTFLSSKCTGKSCSHEVPCERCCIIRAELQNVPIVFLELEDEHRLVKAEQISRTLEGNFEPFLYQLPDKWVPFFKLFQLLGGTVKASIRQYASVLRSIYERGNNAWGNPNVVNMVERATTGLYEELRKTDQGQVAALFDSRHALYLPSCHQNLERSDQLLLNDVDHYLRRLRKSKLPLIKFFQGQERIAKEAIDRLPETMKPTLVSKKVKEILSKTGNGSQRCLLTGQEPCEFARRLQILQSKEFLQAVCIIIKHNGQTVDEETKTRLRNSLSGLKITCMQQLHSILQINGEYIEGSETEVPSFINSESELFVQHSEGENIMETLLNIAIHVNQVLENVFEDKTYLSALLSQKSPSTLHKVLTKFNIAAESMEDDTSFKLPDPGTTIPEQLYHLIEQDPWTSFSVDDFIAYAQTDEDGEYYIYAIVVKRISNESLNSVYLINIGNDKPIEANVLDMHKIHIPKSTSGMELVLSDKVHSEDAGPCLTGNQESSFPTDMEQAKRQVTTELEEIWKLPEEHRRKAIRRMLLKWHPDKHPEGPKELFDEAFKHFKSELQRLEKGISRTSSFYEDLFRSTEKRAREDRRRYTHFRGFWGGGGFRGRGSFGSGFWNCGSDYSSFEDFFTFASRTPDIRNARRWFRQGQEDLRAAGHDLNPHDDKPSLEWVAYKCHQSVEKALKAAKLAIDGQHDYTHSISFLAYQVEGKIKSVDFLQNVNKISSLVNDQRARYPDICASSQIPHDVFREMSRGEEMIELARLILGNVQSFLLPRS